MKYQPYELRTLTDLLQGQIDSMFSTLKDPFAYCNRVENNSTPEDYKSSFDGRVLLMESMQDLIALKSKINADIYMQEKEGH